MEAKELRIDNWFDPYYSEAKQATLSDISTINIAENDERYQNVSKPIPLTEEWLVKLGFESQKTSHTDRMVYWSRCITIEYLKSGSVWITILGIKRKDWNICRYVHQLQNLYFALTGEELTSN